MAESKTTKANDPNRLVKIKLFKDKGRYQDDVTVVVNCVTYKIQRGVEVEVPYYVAEVLNNSEMSDSKTAAKIDEVTK